jgi:hydroxymethylpyrimidine pyrophosphatase-like HAD family hydrolase
MVRRCNEEERLLHVPVDADMASTIVRHCIEHRLHLDYFIDDKLYMTHVDYWGRIYLSRTGDMPIPVGDLRQFDGRTPTKLLVSADPALVEKLLPLEQERWAGKLFVTHSLPEYIEYLNPDATKGNALQWLAEYLQLPMSAVMGMGDQLNDLTMIERAGVGVAMPGACDRVKEAADYVSQSSAEGVAEAILRYLDP